MNSGNLYGGIPESITEELIEALLDQGALKIERIISRGHASPEGFWYDQETDEWVVVLQGSAGIRLEGSEDVVVLKPGDWLFVPAHRKHRVEWTEAGRNTIWLAVHHLPAEVECNRDRRCSHGGQR